MARLRLALPHLRIGRHLCRAGLLALAMLLPVSAPMAQAAASSAAPPVEPGFDIFEFVVEGNSVLPADAIERAVYPFLGPNRRFADVEAARQALEAAYKSQGYGFAAVDIPEQRADTGAIQLRVAEGRVARTRVTGSRYFSQGYILERVANASEGEVPHLPTLQAQLLDVNRTADRRVTPLLRPGREPGTTEVDLTVEDKLPLHASLELNNRASRDTSSTRLQASVSYDNLFQRDHRIALQAVLSPEKPKEVKVISASYTVPLGPAGLESMVFSATRSDSEVAVSLGNTTLFGKGSILGLRRSFMLNLRDDEFQLMTLGLDYKDLQETVDAGEGAGFKTPITYLPLSAAWTGIYRTPSSEWQFGATLAGGIQGLVNRQSEFRAKRFQANASYALWRLDAKHNRTLPWHGLRLRAQVETQLTGQPLISNEQFVVGGADSVRGFREAEAVGDFGLRTSLQVSTADLASGLGWPSIAGLSAHAFLDAAAAQLHEPLPGQNRRYGLVGGGLGLQMSTRGLVPMSLALDLAWPLARRGFVGPDGLRVHASALFGF